MRRGQLGLNGGALGSWRRPICRGGPPRRPGPMFRCPSMAWKGPNRTQDPYARRGAVDGSAHPLWLLAQQAARPARPGALRDAQELVVAERRQKIGSLLCRIDAPENSRPRCSSSAPGFPLYEVVNHDDGPGRDAAKEAGKLDELTALADRLAGQKVENAMLLQILAYLFPRQG